MRRFFTTLFCLLVASLFLTDTAVWAQQAQVIRATRVNTSQSLSDMIRTAAPVAWRAPYAIPNKLFKMGGGGSAPDQSTSFADPVRQAAMGSLAPTIGVNFDGSNDDDNAALVGFRIVPPDTDGDVGPNHYVQWINLVSEIFDKKNGGTIKGPFAGNAYFSGLGGDCDANNDGDPIVLYDEVADRWLVSQFAVTASPYSMCIAISETADPTGAYHQYEFNFGRDFPDYPKLGIWNDSYVMTTRDFANGRRFAGLSAVALDRAAMLSGVAATMVRFRNAFGNNVDGYLPADVDGPITGPAVFGGHGADGDTTFELWELDVDWTNPGAATFTSIPGVGISPYDGVAPSANQPNGQVLDDLSGFTMHRLNVRDFVEFGYRSMVANHTVEVSTGVLGIRWYEFRNTGSGWTLYQEGTYSPDNEDRWMGSIAINAAGDISLGYSKSSSSSFPSIYFTGQTVGAPLNAMNVAETLIHAGGGSQSGASRWGDYSMMSVDPVDGTSFWYTTEYYADDGSFDFNTRIANFELGTSGPINQPPVVTITAPANGANFESGALVPFTGTADDFEDIDISGSIDWRSSIDEFLGTGASISFSLSDGAHTITASATDSGSPTGTTETGSAHISVTVGTQASTSMTATVVAGTQNAGQGKKRGTATVTVTDNLGNPVDAATVTVDFGAPFDQERSGNTDGSGVVTLVTTNTARGGQANNFQVCISDVMKLELTWTQTPDPVCATPNAAAAKALANAETPEGFALEQNYPNPFNPTTLIAYSLAEAGPVTLKVYNVLGQEVAALVDGYKESGRHRVAFDASRLSAGVYLYVIEAGGFTATKRMTLFK